jgi:TetR/AcrR family transcriptional regulator
MHHLPPPRVRRQPEATRAAILKAALAQFASEGVEGARTDVIARQAGVNKALLYYYFEDKEALYGAVLDQVYASLMDKVIAAMDAESDPGRRILAYAGAHFDFAAKSPFLPKLVLREMMRGSGLAGATSGRASHGPTTPFWAQGPASLGASATGISSPHLARIAEKFIRPLQTRLSQTLLQGIRAGIFRPIDPEEFIPTMVGAIVFFFISLPVTSQVSKGNPLSAERLAKRRAAVLDFISAALFEPKYRGERAARTG